MNICESTSVGVYPVILHSLPGELLSSWIERFGLFYGVDYSRWPACLANSVGHVVSATRHDVDIDERFRALLQTLTSKKLPKTLDATSPSILIFGSRSAFCPTCWDDDVAGGNVPFIRREWSFWHRVICPLHKTFLNTRFRIGQRVAQGSPSWAPVWRTKKSWARSLELSPDRVSKEEGAFYAPGSYPCLAPHAIAILGDEIERFGPDDSRNAPSMASVTEAKRRALRVLELVMSQGFVRVVEDVRRELIGPGGEHRLGRWRFDNLNYCDMHRRPQLLENRMAVLTTAAEVLRVTEYRKTIDSDLANAVTLSVHMRHALDNVETRRYLSRWPDSERENLLQCWPTGLASRLKVSEILAQKRSRCRA
jgi:hypothetical protein